MSDIFYDFIRAVGRPLLFCATRRLVLHEERARETGGCLLAANHQSYYDSMILVGTTTRRIDWVSIVELFKGPWQRRFMRGINCMALDRSRRDPRTTREIVRRLRAGRVVGLFPEAQLRKGEDSVLYGGHFTSGVVRLAELGQVPIIPVIVLGGGQFSRFRSWLPGARTTIIVNYGLPIHFDSERPRLAARAAMETEIKTAFACLFEELKTNPFVTRNARNDWWLTNSPHSGV